ncbi:MAG: ATP-binding protein [Pseudomonadota bacterium]
MASAQQLIGLIKSHAEGDKDRFYDLALQLAATEDQKGHKRLAQQLRDWADAGQSPPLQTRAEPTPISTPRGSLTDILSASYPTARLNDVILSSDLKHELTQIVFESRMIERLEEKGLKPRRRILLAGPPGTGKTLSAAALAGELKFPLFTVLLHGLITKFMGETAQKLRLIFDAVRNTRGVYLFDEIDALAAARSSSNDVGEARRILNSFLQFLDENIGPSIIVATTNLPEILDRAILRRFDLVLPYTLPEGSAIEKAMRRRLIQFDVSKVDWDSVAYNAGGLSTADVVAAAEDAARKAVLGNSGFVETPVLIASLVHRRSLQEIGALRDAKRQRALRAKRSGKFKKVRSQGRRVEKKAERRS